MKILFVYNGAEVLGIEYLSSVLKQEGHETFLLFDPAFFSGDQLINSQFLARVFSVDQKIIEKAASTKPDLIGFSTFSGNYRWCLKIAQALKEKLGVPIVFGGVHATAVPKRVLENDFIDYVISGEGEGAILDLVKVLDKKRVKHLLRRIPNLCFRDEGQIRFNPPRLYIHDLDSLPFPDKELFYQKLPSLADNYLIMTARGCPYDCTFCSNNMFHQLYGQEHQHIRRRSPQNVISELKEAKRKRKIRLVNFADDVFTSSTAWLEEFIPMYKSEIGIPFFCSVHPMMINPKSAALLKEGGCWLVTMGVQSGSERIRKKIFNRWESNEQIIKSISLLKQAGLKVSVDNIFGAPSETEKDLQKSLKLYNQIKADRTLTVWLTYYPRTKIIDYAKKYKLVTDKEIGDTEKGIVGFCHDTGSVKPERVGMYLPYLLLFQLRTLFDNDRLYSFFSRLVVLLPFKKAFSKLIIFLNAVKNKDIKFIYLLKILWAEKNVP